MEMLEHLRRKQSGIAKKLYDENSKYKDLMSVVTDFSASYNQKVHDVAKFLVYENFHQICDVYIRIGHGNFIKLDKENSEKSILFVLNFLSDGKFKKEDDVYKTDYYELIHILIDEQSLYNFKELNDIDVDVCVGHYIFEDIKFGDIDKKKLNKIRDEYYQDNLIVLGGRWKEHEQVDQEAYNIASSSHPSLDTSNENHAPELLLAVQAWEAKYINNEYPYMEHTPAIKAFLNKLGYTTKRLQDRISAITNPKDINKSNN